MGYDRYRNETSNTPRRSSDTSRTYVVGVASSARPMCPSRPIMRSSIAEAAVATAYQCFGTQTRAKQVVQWQPVYGFLDGRVWVPKHEHAGQSCLGSKTRACR